MEGLSTPGFGERGIERRDEIGEGEAEDAKRPEKRQTASYRRGGNEG